ncbi:1-acylglycerol-3-phosphate O-acyltransferase [Nocardia sp. NPDC050413]|uniref:1-acylglycerol-3-phosphate O-acyltransferase n=1 Tax=Nocardia sp. NPDC050413 TaxID=3155784 RepID=UPI0033C42F4E
MSGIDDAVTAIRTGPQGDRVLAVFDARAVVDALPRKRLPGKRRRRGDDRRNAMLTGFRRDHQRFLREAERAWAGVPEAELEKLGRGIFRKEMHGRIFPEAWQLVREHRSAGHTVLLVSELPAYQVGPFAELLGIDNVLCTKFATDNGILTGQLDGPPLWGTEKAEAVGEFAAARDCEIGYVYADTPALLESAGIRSVDPCAFQPRTAPSAIDYARTVLAFVALVAGAMTGVIRKSYTRDRQAMADALMHDGTTATLRTLGVELRVVGAENARAPRPAVFLFNHQSQFDVIIVPKVLDGGVTGIGKKELRSHPLFGPLMRFVGVTFIDRSDTERAKAALAPVVSTLREGLSIAVAPEGTRSYTRGLGPFKKGAFHIAKQAGVPVIPIVIRNAGDIAWRDSPIARSGVVDVAILPPIDVSTWNPAAMDEEIEEVRRLYEHTLLNWPSA